MSKIIRKSKKLFKTPRLFFRDMKLIGSKKTEAIIERHNSVDKVLDKNQTINVIKTNKSVSNVKISSLVEDFITPHHQEELIFKILDKAGVNYHFVNVDWKHILRIAIQDSMLNEVIKLLRESELFTKDIYIANGKDRFDLVKIYFHDDTTIFKNIIIQFDPWYMTPSGALTRNRNNQIQFVPKAHVNKTVHSFAPIRLGRSTDDIDNINSMIGIDSFMFDEYKDPIDIVFTWVSDSDPLWLENKNRFSQSKSGELNTRFYDYEQLRYSLRSVAYYAKFIRNIYIVTDNQIPYWLDISHERIHIIDHKDIFEDLEVLPVFNSVAIESWIHKIPGLSENFIYANDDYFFGSPVTKSHFIHPNGIAKLFLEPIPNAYGEIFEDSEPTNQLSLFTAECFYKKYNHWPSFWPLHAPMIKNISLINEMTEEFKELTLKTGRSRFRENGTISPLYLLSSYYAFEKSKCVVSAIRYDYVSTDAPNLDAKLTLLLKKIKSNSCDVFCLNDHRSVSESQVLKVVNFMKEAFPIPVNWEIDNDL